MPQLAWAVAGALLGLIAGSFLATLVLRWPRDETVVKGRSACDHCGKPLAICELIPLASWLWSHGRCRGCGAPIEPVHPVMEGLCALVGASALLIAPGSAGVAGAVFGWILIALAALDLRHFWLPDRLVLALLLVSVMSWLTGLAPAGADRLFGALGGFAALTLVAAGYRVLRKRDGLGAGDAKMFGALGAMLGWQPLPLVLVGASSIGLLLVAARLAGGEKILPADKLPFGALLALAAYPVWIFQQ